MPKKATLDDDRITTLENSFREIHNMINGLKGSQGAFPPIVHNYSFVQERGDFHVLESDWEVGTHAVVVANTENCYRYRITNKGPSTVTVTAEPSGKKTEIKAGSVAYVECSKITLSTSYGHAHGDIDRA